MKNIREGVISASRDTIPVVEQHGQIKTEKTPFRGMRA